MIYRDSFIRPLAIPLRLKILNQLLTSALEIVVCALGQSGLDMCKEITQYDIDAISIPFETHICTSE
jgi:hypothetical protein